MTQVNTDCPHCVWWADKERRRETFVCGLWEWDVDKAAKLKPYQEDEIEVAVWGVVVDYPQEKGKFYPMRVPVRVEHLDHVPLDRPLLFGMWERDGVEVPLLIDGHHRLARAIRDDVARLPARVLSAKQLMSCVLHRPLKRRKR